MRLLVVLVITILATAYAQSLAPETGVTTTSTVLTSMIGSTTDCTQLRQWRNGCCTDTSSPCCRNCASATSVFEGCPAWKRESTCCKEPGQTCCKKDCWIEPEVKDIEEHRAPLMKDDLDGCAQKQKDVNQCCQPGETTCCTKCPLPFVFAQIDSSISTSAPGTDVAPPPPAPIAAVTPQPPAPAPAPAPAPVPATPAVPPQKRLIFAKVDCTAEKRTATCCRGPVDHKYRCCNQDLQCQVAQSKIGDMKMGTLCLESTRLSTCCSQPGQTCCRQCATPPALIPAQPISAVTPPACPAAVTTCCTATVTSCCNKCSQ